MAQKASRQHLVRMPSKLGCQLMMINKLGYGNVYLLISLTASSLCLPHRIISLDLLFTPRFLDHFPFFLHSISSLPWEADMLHVSSGNGPPGRRYCTSLACCSYFILCISWHDYDYLPQCKCRWMGDGRYFAVSAIDAEAGGRRIRVWTRDGVLHSTCELVTGLEHTLDWR